MSVAEGKSQSSTHWQAMSLCPKGECKLVGTSLRPATEQKYSAKFAANEAVKLPIKGLCTGKLQHVAHHFQHSEFQFLTEREETRTLNSHLGYFE